jgi:folate-binding Fe-S cluster repair protein YgfZ
VGATVSFTKGCYTGQELVGRLEARGSNVPWRLVWAAGPNVERIDEVLRSRGPAGPQGVTTAVRRGGRVEALGFAHRTLLDPSRLDPGEDVAVEVVV